ncbi:MAG: peptidase [Nitrososphaerota archaeon]
MALFAIQVSSADVWIPEDEYLGYFDSENVYTVVGAVKNTEIYAINPTITIVVTGSEKVTLEQKLPTVFPNKDIPFKITIPQIGDREIVLEKPLVSFEKETAKSPSNVQVIYDRSLKKHKDGHLTGKIINQGNATEYDLKVYATIHGDGNVFLDTGKNIEKIEKIEPGQIIDFTMYPEPSIASDINYYSCFAIGDETIVPLSTVRNGDKFDFRYDSTAAFTVVGFDESGTRLYIDGINSFKVPTFVNFEFPKTSDSEKFSVLVNDAPTKSIQSLDDDGNWHVAFDVDGASQSKILISGFENQHSQVIVSQNDTNKIGTVDYSILYYAIPITVGAGIGLYFYGRQKTKLVG